MSNRNYPLNDPPGALEQSEDTKTSVTVHIAPGTDLNEVAATVNEDSTQPQPVKKESQPKRGASKKKPVDNLKEKLLAKLLEREQVLCEAATKPVVFSQPIISRGDVGIIGRSTLNIIQGAYGSHKSRMAELLAALMLTTNSTDDPQFLEFKRIALERFCVCYIDTERNQGEELPFAIQGIKTRAGYSLEDIPADFRVTSIKSVERKDRFEAIEAFISHVREQTALHLFCLIDVVTDAVGDFNDAKESMRLYDFIGNLCDHYNATFLLVIHQNPGTDKARGHTGTEAANKANTVMQIGFEKDTSGNDTDMIRLKFLKLRRGKRPEPVYLQYSEEAKGLALADAEQIAAQVNYRKHKADTEDVADRLISLLSEGAMPKGEVWTILESEFKAKNATIRNRLKAIMTDPPEMYDEEGRAVRLADYNQGKNQFYRLVPIG
ncbi:hypothetical protein GCM10023187_12330 [Nibrella viscosa]|uniref:AAA domain-containing protein n=1 Tax=Nibrella viscosa TaxID=1084524 RepID=A0ABP8K3W8_9BACT